MTVFLELVNSLNKLYCDERECVPNCIYLRLGMYCCDTCVYVSTSLGDIIYMTLLILLLRKLPA